MLEIVIIRTRYFPFLIIIPCSIPPPPNGSGFSFKVFLVVCFFFYPFPFPLQLYSWKGEVTKPLFNQTGSAVAGRGGTLVFGLNSAPDPALLDGPINLLLE